MAGALFVLRCCVAPALIIYVRRAPVASTPYGPQFGAFAPLLLKRSKVKVRQTPAARKGNTSGMY